MLVELFLDKMLELVYRYVKMMIIEPKLLEKVLNKEKALNKEMMANERLLSS